MKKSALILTLVAVCGCSSHEIHPASRKAGKLLAANPITHIAPDAEAPATCSFLRTIYAGPGIGVAREQDLVLRQGAIIGATHVKWRDQEIADFYRCAPAHPQDQPLDAEGNN